MQNSFHSKSYEAQAETYLKLSESHNLDVEKYKEWYKIDTIDIWRHIRMFEPVKIVLKNNPDSNWLTLADGGFGLSAIYIEKAGGKALATDIDVNLLMLMKEKGLLSNYEIANAESLSYSDDSFDFIHCKSAYHHFPRPMIALYEMIRVAKKAIVLTEPSEFLPLPFPRSLIFKVYRGIKKALGLSNVHVDTGRYETVGNYIYSLSIREIEKVCIALNLPMIAFKKFHDHYDPKFEGARIRENKLMFSKLKFRIFKLSILSFLGLSQLTNIHCIIFKQIPQSEMLSDLKANGFTIIKLPSNPYL